MEKYYCYQDAVDDLNKKGFTNDFVLFGDELLWIQQKKFIQSNDFFILECHCSGHPGGDQQDLIVLGIIAVSANIKGILLNHYSYNKTTPEVITKKMRTAKY